MNIVIVISLFSSCKILGWGHKFYLDESGNIKPSKPDFKLKGELESYSGDLLIDTSSIYLSSLRYKVYGEDNYDTAYSMIRFFSDGKYFSKYFGNDEPSEVELEQLTNGVFGYYTFTDHEIIVETFAKSEMLADYFLTKYRVMNSNQVVAYKVKKRCWNCGWSSTAEIFVKYIP